MRSHLFTSSAGIRHDFEDDGQSIVIHSSQDLTPLLDHNKAMATHNDGYSPSREWRRAASIPAMVRLKWLAEEGWDCFDLNCRDKLKAKLNSNEYLYLRTAPGRL